MAIESIPFWLVPASTSYKNGDIILRATIKNVNDKKNLKENKKIKPSVYFNAEDSNSYGNEILISNVAHKRRLFPYQLLNIYNYTKSQGILFTDVTLRKSYELQNNYKKKKVQNLAPFNTHKHNLTINSGSNSRVIKSLSDTVPSRHCYTTTNPYSKLSWKVYRCQLSTREESCCCSCNSDAMFEVMKSLYDCYKKKNCDNCNCILCGHLPREERRLGEQIKLGVEAEVGKKETLLKERLNSKTSDAVYYEGKSSKNKEQIYKEMAMAGKHLPEGKTKSDKDLIKKVRTELGLPPEPEISADKKKMSKAYKAGLITPLEGKTKAEKEKLLKTQAAIGIPLPEGRTPSEKALIAKVKETIQKVKAEGSLTPLEGKSKQEKERILKGLAKQGLPLPEPKTASDQKLMDRIRNEVGLPPQPKTPSAKEKYNRAMAAGLITPLEGKSLDKKENILRGQAIMGLSLPEGRTPSERALIDKVKETRRERHVHVPSEKIRKAKAEGLLTPLEGKSKKEKEKILKGLAKHGLPLPEAKTASDQKQMDKIRTDLGLPPEPKTSSAKAKYDRAMSTGLITPLEGKSMGKKEQILHNQAKMGLQLPEGRTPSEKFLIAKVKAITRPEREVHMPSEKIRKAKADGLLTPLEGKSKQEKEKILKGLAKQGLPLPEPKTASDRKLIDRIRNEVGLPSQPKTPSTKEKYDRAMAAGFITPLEGKSLGKKEQILRNQAKMGLQLPEGITPSEKSLIAKVKATTRPERELRVPSEKIRKAKAEGLLTPLEGKSKQEKERILKGLAKQGLPLPEPKTTSDRKLMDKIRNEVGLPPEPKTPSAKEKYDRAMAAGLITPLEGKSIAKKEQILRDQAKIGLLLPEARTPSEKALIEKVKATSPHLSKRTALTPEKFKKLNTKTAKVMKEKNGSSDECICDLLTPESEKQPVGIDIIKMLTRKGTPVKVSSNKIQKAKADGLLTPLEGKPKKEKKRILRGLAKHGIPLPEAKTESDQKLVDKIRTEVGLPPEPKTPSAKAKYDRAMAAGLITPLEGKSMGKKEQILQDQAKMGLLLPEGRTPSEKALITKVKEKNRPEREWRVPLEKINKAKDEGLLTPLKGKPKEEQERILKGLAKLGLPLPEATNASDQKLIEKVRNEVGLPPEPKTLSAKAKFDRAMASGLITPLGGESMSKKEQILRNQAKMGLQLPEGRTPSEKALIAKVKETTGPDRKVRVPSEKMRKAKAEGLLTPLVGKSKKEMERILKGLAKHGLPLPEAKTGSEQKLIDKVRNEVGLPPEPKTSSAKAKYDKAMAAGLVTPLEGKSMIKKEQILRDQAKLGLQLPEGRTPSEKALIAKVKETTRSEIELRVPSEKIRKAKAEGLLTPLEGKSRQEKERILKGLARQGLPLPESTTASDRKLMDRIRNEVGLPPEPKTLSTKEKYDRAIAAGLITPLEGKSLGRKEQILRDQAKMGLLLPEARTPFKKALIEKVKATSPHLSKRTALPPEQFKKLDTKTAKVIKEKKGPSDECICDLLTPESEKQPVSIDIFKMPTKKGTPIKVPSEKIHKAKVEGLLTPFEGKSKKEKEKILRGLAKHGIPLPEAKTESDQKLVDKIRTEVGLPPEPKTPSAKAKYDRAIAAGLITPLEGKSMGKKEQILRDQLKMGLPLPEGRTSSEKALIAKVKVTTRPVKEVRVPSEKIRKAKAEGLLTPLEGKSKKVKEKILKGLANQGLPFPEAKTASDRKVMDKIRTEIGLPSEPKTPSAKAKYDRAMAAGLITPLEGKSLSKKEQILQNQAKMGLPLPEGRTISEKALIAKVKETIKKEGSLISSKALILPETASEKEILRKAKAAGILTPLKGKSLAQKEKILKGLADAGLPMPEGATPSGKILVQKVRAMAGLPPEATPSEKKGKIKQRSKKIDVGGIIEELEDITRTTTCDRGCGCDKKKIRFKHSYVKIRVTSPDISSLCSCPEECVPGVKKGVFTDNEGIKVTIGRVTGVPSFASREMRELKRKINIRISDTTCCSSRVNIRNAENNNSSKHYYTSNTVSRLTNNLKSCFNDSSRLTKSCENFHKDNTARIIKSCSKFKKPQLFRNEVTEEFYTSQVSTSSSLETIYLLKTDSCLSFPTESEVYSVISFSVTETSSYSDYNKREDSLNIEYEEIIKSNENITHHYCTSDFAVSIMNTCSTDTYWTSKILVINPENVYDREILPLLKCIQSESSQSKYLLNQRHQRSDTNFKEINTDSEILNNVSEILSRISLDDSSSLLFILPSSNNENAADYNYYLDVPDSCLVIQMSEHYAKRNYTTHEPRDIGRNKGIKMASIGNFLKDVPSIEVSQNDIIEQKQRFFSTDTIEDRPCCCTPLEANGDRGFHVNEHISDEIVVSDLVKPTISNEAVARGHTTCSACERSKWDDTSTKENKSYIKNKSCPCSFGHRIASQETNDTRKGKSNNQREKKKTKKNKKLKCECAEVLSQLLPEFQFTADDWIDDAQARKMNSDLTQTVSGFKFNVLRKKPQAEMSFEEILKFYADSYEQKYKNLNYSKNGKLQTETNAATDCECPPSEQQDTSRAEEPLQGIKFHIAGKGSGSKRLNGILCF